MEIRAHASYCHGRLFTPAEAAGGSKERRLQRCSSLVSSVLAASYRKCFALIPKGKTKSPSVTVFYTMELPRTINYKYKYRLFLQIINNLWTIWKHPPAHKTFTRPKFLFLLSSSAVVSPMQHRQAGFELNGVKLENGTLDLLGTATKFFHSVVWEMDYLKKRLQHWGIWAASIWSARLFVFLCMYVFK